MLRQPIVTTLGHVDHGKTSLLDAIRNTRITSIEAGGISQHVGASEVPVDVIKKVCGPLLGTMHISLTIPGLLFIDTPGHEAFANLRRRGGSIADIAILVIDVTKGIEAQTVEAINILREYKTPFVVALNKIDAISGWIPQAGKSFGESAKVQRDDVLTALDEKTYTIIGDLYNHGFSAERYDRVGDFTKQIVMVPVSARTHEGLPELLVLVSGLAQRFLEGKLTLEAQEAGRASILEVRDEKGLGKTLDCILYGGTIAVNDPIIFAGMNGVVESKVKALLKPNPLAEMRDTSEKFKPVSEAVAASGVKIACEGADIALAGSELFVVRTQEARAAAREELEAEIKEILFSSSKNGVVLYADALGSVEAITKMLEAEKIPVRSASVGTPTKKDIHEAASVGEKERFLGALLAFNVHIPDDVMRMAEEQNVKVFDEKIIYRLVEGYTRWIEEEKSRDKREAFSTLILPAKIKILPHHCFRVSKPCVVGVEVMQGTLKSNSELLDSEGNKVGELKQIQRDKESVGEAKMGEQVAVSIEGPVFGRQLHDGDVLYVNVPKDDQLALEGKYKATLSPEDFALLKEIKVLKGLRA
jgi:translation initiation factor 5B